MKIEIWSDVMCPFCYIGKRNLEKAMEQFTDKNQIEIIWKSFQLDPSAPEVSSESMKDYLVKTKGMSHHQVDEMLESVTQTASAAGLDYHFEKAVMANSQNAHRLIQFAKTKNLGNEIEERLFYAYFTEGKNIADTETLTELGKDIGLDETEVQTALTNEEYHQLMQEDIREARSLGVTGVPFFVFDRKYAISGAQPVQTFLSTLTKSFSEWQEKPGSTR